MVSEKRLQWYRELLKDTCFFGDPEIDHQTADSLLCNLLCELGHQDIVAMYNKVRKWYA